MEGNFDHHPLYLSPCDGALHPAVYQHTPALPPAPYHKPKYEPVVYEEEYPKQNCSVVDETIKVIPQRHITKILPLAATAA